MAEMEKRRVGTRFMEYEVDKNDFNQPIFVNLYHSISSFFYEILKTFKLVK